MRLRTILAVLVCVILAVQGQHFHPDVVDKKFLDRIDADVSGETRRAQETLIDQARIVENVATVFIGTKLKQNLFRVNTSTCIEVN